MRRNIDAWWPLEQGLTTERKVEAIVMNASSWAAAVKSYGHALAYDLAHNDLAKRVSALARDLSEVQPAPVRALKAELKHGAGPATRRLAFHPPCNLQRGQQLRGDVETGWSELGFEASFAASESRLRCGSAGTCSVLQPKPACALRDRMLAHLAPLEPQAVVNANIGCIQHL